MATMGRRVGRQYRGRTLVVFSTVLWALVTYLYTTETTNTVTSLRKMEDVNDGYLNIMDPYELKLKIDKSLPHSGDNRKRYLFPLYDVFDGGPNWAYSMFRIGLHLAVYQNRTIVTVPFRVHDRLQEDVMFSLKSVEETLDVDQIREMVPVISVREFYNECKDELDNNLELELIELILDHTMDNIKRFWKMFNTLEELRETHPPKMALTDKSSADEHRNFLDFTTGKRCLVITKSNDFRFLQTPSHKEIEVYVDKHFSWASYIKDLVNPVFGSICGGKKFAALHWRNRTGEGCIEGSKWAKKICNDKEKREVQDIIKISPQIAKSVVEFIHSKGLQCLYVSYPPFKQELIHQMGKVISNIYSIDDVIELSPAIANIKDDLYVISMVEQEIAVRSDFFIGWRVSSWSGLVRRMRTALNKPCLALPWLPAMPKKLLEVE